MKNKKYRPIKLWIILFIIVILTLLLGLFLLDGWRKVVMLSISGIMSVIMFLAFTYYFEVQENRILIRHGLSSFNKKYRSSFKTRTILFNEISNLDFIAEEKAIIISLKNENSIYFSIKGYLHHSEIIKLVYDIKKQI